ncbi:tldD protein [Buchnera aphidicola str. APS (Acyrthosiphon pisum)]|uniref:Metalloprotease TldD homolog n=1 Tax=Buchnera aphidicola subsp. Acyrthosiphon pisum (strain APS) TaxID=107806 RepID=TLDD_BUCAI|nr:metalloprotease TldD [Buchnera aphidicola]P57478.1 RecName: Full=Metalloprotease TldD homolog [Buchnera aphidicola str. APS (Acyrthosiphon pisum)]pir/E84976/ tldD protein [imported] - Buchnera sp. (strain APS) [Buchnera sp. (in: enterobacteria)]BAB13101.1 tldD protein [Buchnera aphidicola str. APS (Acyrthosiphon pisum)]
MTFELVTESLLNANKINDQDVFIALEELCTRQLDYGDLYFQSHIHESWILENSIIKEGNYHSDAGIGVRAIRGESTGFAYSDQISLDSLRRSTKKAHSIILTKGSGKTKTLSKKTIEPIYKNVNPLEGFSSKEKTDLLYRANYIARSLDHRVIEVNASLTGSYEQILVASTDGNLVSDIRPSIQFSISVLVEDHGKRERGRSGGGSRTDYNFFLNQDDSSKEIRIDHWSKEAVRIALLNLSSKEALSGTFPVVLGSGWPGVLLHEAIGHGLEGDFNRKGTSIFTNMIGKKVASELCTIIDDGTIKNQRGSLSIDDEGTPGQKNILIENGILKKYMQDKLNARLMGVKSTGNGRRESYSCLPMPRMTNTYMLSGKSKLDDIIKSVDYGIYAVNFSGGQVDITSGKFVFSTSEAYLIKNGKIVTPIKNTTLIGSGLEVMQKISMVGDDLKMDEGMGICGKDGQNIPVGIGQPSMKLENLTIGGTV